MWQAMCVAAKQGHSDWPTAARGEGLVGGARASRSLPTQLKFAERVAATLGDESVRAG